MQSAKVLWAKGQTADAILTLRSFLHRRGVDVLCVGDVAARSGICQEDLRFLVRFMIWSSAAEEMGPQVRVGCVISL